MDDVLYGYHSTSYTNKTIVRGLETVKLRVNKKIEPYQELIAVNGGEHVTT